MSAIGPGDFVECVSRSANFPDRLADGAIYSVRAVVPGPFKNSDFGVHLREVDNANPNGWSNHLFRPVYRPKQELIQSLKAPPINAPARVSEDA